jgi:hypothetical protein
MRRTSIGHEMEEQKVKITPFELQKLENTWLQPGALEIKIMTIQQESATKILGVVTTYHGSEHSYLRGQKVRIVAIIKNAARGDDCSLDADNAYLKNDADIHRYGGVTVNDRVEVQPWIEKKGRFSFATSDPRAIDLAAFAHLVH